MKLSLVSGCAIGILLLGGCATSPKKHVPTVEELWKKADKNSDGKVSRAEYQEFMFEQMFAVCDPSGDGFITVEEYVADGGTAAEFKKLNVSGTGKLSLEEAKKSPMLQKRLVALFDEVDVNRNGTVTWEEFQIWRVKSDAYNR